MPNRSLELAVGSGKLERVGPPAACRTCSPQRKSKDQRHGRAASFCVVTYLVDCINALRLQLHARNHLLGHSGVVHCVRVLAASKAIEINVPAQLHGKQDGRVSVADGRAESGLILWAIWRLLEGHSGVLCGGRPVACGVVRQSIGRLQDALARRLCTPRQHESQDRGTQ
eukprot:scaffold740_cov405-Prasinococcus_capsulatus_cf.AAC.13